MDRRYSAAVRFDPCGAGGCGRTAAGCVQARSRPLALRRGRRRRCSSAARPWRAATPGNAGVGEGRTGRDRGPVRRRCGRSSGWDGC